MPANASLIVQLPGLDRLRELVGPALTAQASEALAAAFADSAGVTFDAARALLTSFDGAVLFSTATGGSLGGTAAMRRAAVALRFRDAEPVDQLLAASKLERQSELDWVEPGAGDGPAVRARFGRAAGLLVVALDGAVLESSWRAALGVEPSFERVRPKAGQLEALAWIYADLQRLTEGEPEAYGPGSRLLFTLGHPSPAEPIAAELDVAQLGEFVPRVGLLFDPPERTVLGRLPSGPLGAVGLSTKRRADVGFGAVLEELGRARKAPGLLVHALGTLGKLGLSIADLDRAVGDELAVGLYAEPAARGAVRSSGGPRGSAPGADQAGAALELDALALAGALESADADAARKMLAAVGQALRAVAPVVRSSPGRLVLRPNPRTEIRAELRAGAVAFAAGPPERVAQLMGRFDRARDGLGDDEAFRSAAAQAHLPAHVRIYLDYQAMARAGLASDAPESSGASAGRAAMATVVYQQSDRGLELWAHTGNGVALVGLVAGIAAQGVRHYLEAARAAQASAAVEDPASE